MIMIINLLLLLFFFRPLIVMILRIKNENTENMLEWLSVSPVTSLVESDWVEVLCADSDPLKQISLLPLLLLWCCSGARVARDTELVGHCVLHCCLFPTHVRWVAVATSAGVQHNRTGSCCSVGERCIQDCDWERLARCDLSRQQVPACKYDSQ